MDCCPMGKQGPMRATLPVSSIRNNDGPKNSGGNSPPLSPTSEWRRVSVDQALTRQRSPEAVNYKGKGRFGGSVIRRTASLDTLYHKGQWSRDYYLHAGQLQVDKSTQTDEGGVTSRSSSRSSEDDNVHSILRTLQRPHRPFAHGYGDYSGPSMSTALWSRFGSSCASLRTTQSSADGLNQEIERIVLYPANGTQTPHHIDWLRDKIIPEGHRAPFGIFRRRSVNTQTPPDLYHTAHSSGGSVCSSPNLDSSYFLVHVPDGCEKVKAGVGPIPEPVPLVKPTVLRPPLGSSFENLPPASPNSPPAPAPH